MTKMIWHYTTGLKYALILRDGMLKPVKDFVWFSSSQSWEPGADGCGVGFKSLFPAADSIRIGVPSEYKGLTCFNDQPIYKGASFSQKFCHNMAVKALNKAGKKWYVSSQPIPLSNCKVERYDGRKWVKFDLRCCLN